MGKSRFEYFTGEAAWAHRLFIPDDKYNFWSVDLKLSPEERKRLKDNGSKLKPNENGYIKFRRPTEKTWRGVLTQLEPPAVLNSEGEPWGDELIGNGSTITVKVEIYDTTFNGKPTTGTRLVSARVDELVEYIKPGDSTTVESTPEPTPSTAMPF